jgi:hypothetical protein
MLCNLSAMSTFSYQLPHACNHCKDVTGLTSGLWYKYNYKYKYKFKWVEG